MRDLSARLDAIRGSWRTRGCGPHACFSAWTFGGRGRQYQSAKVLVRRRQAETVEAMLTRGLDELDRRLREGMPARKPGRADRRLRERAKDRYRDIQAGNEAQRH